MREAARGEHDRLARNFIAKLAVVRLDADYVALFIENEVVRRRPLHDGHLMGIKELHQVLDHEPAAGRRGTAAGCGYGGFSRRMRKIGPTVAKWTRGRILVADLVFEPVGSHRKLSGHGAHKTLIRIGGIAARGGALLVIEPDLDKLLGRGPLASNSLLSIGISSSNGPTRKSRAAAHHRELFNDKHLGAGKARGRSSGQTRTTRTDDDHVGLEVFDGKRCGINPRLSAGTDKTNDKSCGCKLEKMSGHEGFSPVRDVYKRRRKSSSEREPHQCGHALWQHPYCPQRKPPIEVFSKKLAFQKPRGKALNHNLKLMDSWRPLIAPTSKSAALT